MIRSQYIMYQLFLILFFLSFRSFSFAVGILENHFLTDIGLPENNVHRILQDTKGFVWLGTDQGLMRYDGYNFLSFRQKDDDTLSLSSNFVNSIQEDGHEKLWIGTDNGLNYLDLKTNQIVQVPFKFSRRTRINSVVVSGDSVFVGTQAGLYQISLSIKDSLKYNKIISHSISMLYVSRKGIVWIGTESGELFRFSQGAGQVPFKVREFPDEILCITEDEMGGMYVGTSANRIYYLSRTGIFQDYDVAKKNGVISKNIKINSLAFDKDRILWAGTSSMGLLKFTTDKNGIRENISDFSELVGTFIESLLIDQSGLLWIGTQGGGVKTLYRKNKIFDHITNQSDVAKTFSSTRISGFLEDSKGRFWVSTRHGGLQLLEEEYQIDSNPKFSHFLADTTNSSAIQFDDIDFIFEDKNKIIWLGTWGGGISRLDFEEDSRHPIFHNYLWNEDDPKISANEVQSYCIDQGGEFWVGSLKGVNKYDPVTDRFLFDEKNVPFNKWLKDFNITRIIQAENGKFWFGTRHHGLYRFDPETHSMQIFRKGEEAGAILTDEVLALLEDQKERIWIGTTKGLYKFNSETGKFSAYLQSDGLPASNINAMIEDQYGSIWIGTSAGLCQFNPDSQSFKNYYMDGGIQNNEFERSYCYHGKDGRIYLGAYNGYYVFHPNNINENLFQPPVYITQFEIAGRDHERKSETIDPEGPSLIQDKTIELEYRENTFTIEFAALSYFFQSRNQYAYILEGAEDEWNHTDNKKRSVTYANLAPGNYSFRVKAANADGVWNNEDAVLNINVLHPWWLQWWAYLLYILFGILALFVTRNIVISRIRWKENLRNTKLKQEKEKQINEMKLRFFTNVSHEFRTPLTLIIAPIREILGNRTDYKLTDELDNKLNLVNNNAQRLLRLVSQLIDFRKSESGQMKLKASLNNLSEFVYEIALPFKELADINNIGFITTDKLKEREIWFDRDKLDIIINNLLSNAFKHVPSNGKVGITLLDDQESYFIQVEDNGRGIPAQDMDKIFHRFYLVEDQKKSASSGIGLALTQRLVNLHGGNIKVESIPNEKTVFTISIPKGDAHLTDDQKVSVSAKNGMPSFVTTSLIPEVAGRTFQKMKLKETKTVLLVEDHDELRNYLAQLLEPYYQVFTANDGMDGWDSAIQKVPDLIISDVMMPRMDGFELCRKLKGDEQTGHIPVILLTAKTAEPFRLQGTKQGADDYISKPFDPHFLLEKVNQLLQGRSAMEKKFSKKIQLGPEAVEISPVEEKIILKAKEVIEKNISNFDFDTHKLALEMGISHSSLYRKLSPLTNCPPAEFIRNTRLERAVQLLADREKTISEIALDVGFLDLKNFRSWFQKQYGATPSQYRKKLKEES